MTRVLVVGGGAREHAIVRALKDSGAEVVAALKNRNPGILRLASKHAFLTETDPAAVVKAARDMGAEVAIIGPEAPLAAGVADALTAAGIACASPTKAAAEAETDKAFLRALMERHRIEGRVAHRTFTSKEGLRDFIHSLGAVAVKPAGLTGGKGVKVTGDHLKSVDEAATYAAECLDAKVSGLPRVVIEEKLEGEEFTLMCFTDGRAVVPMPAIQDHKRAFEGDAGPNTGGMGSYSDADHLLPFLPRPDRDRAVRIVESIVAALKREGRDYRGAIYGQFMLTRDGPKVIEVNARFGDPEAMNALVLLESPFEDVVRGMADGRLPRNVRFRREATVCRYVVPKGYGEKPVAGNEVRVDEAAIAREGARAYYAAVEERASRIYTSTSRAVGVVATGPDIPAAEDRVSRALKHVTGEALFWRRDIGTRELVAKRVAHMNALRRA